MASENFEFLPKKDLNIYPKTNKNLKALFSFYFDKYDLLEGDSVEEMMKITSLSLNQIEFIARKLSESWEIIFIGFFKTTKTSISNLMFYGIDGITKPEEEWRYAPYSSARSKIKEFIEFVKKTETNDNS
jgi:hypothetical protein